jgi:hypothetical protein
LFAQVLGTPSVPVFGSPSAPAKDVGVGGFILYPALPIVTHPYTSVNVKACILMTPTMKNPTYTKCSLFLKSMCGKFGQH